MLVPFLLGMAVASVGFHAIWTQRRRKEERLTRAVMDAIPDAIFCKDRDGVFRRCNRAFSQALFGREPENVVGRTEFDLVDSAQAVRFYEQDAKVLASMKILHREEERILSDGRKHVLETLKGPLLDAQGRLLGVVGTTRDLTDFREPPGGVRQTQGVSPDESGSLSHEFNNLFQAQRGYLEILKVHLADAPEAQQQLVDHALEVLKKATDRLTGGHP